MPPSKEAEPCHPENVPHGERVGVQCAEVCLMAAGVQSRARLLLREKGWRPQEAERPEACVDGPSCQSRMCAGITSH